MKYALERGSVLIECLLAATLLIAVFKYQQATWRYWSGQLRKLDDKRIAYDGVLADGLIPPIEPPKQNGF